MNHARTSRGVLLSLAWTIVLVGYGGCSLPIPGRPGAKTVSGQEFQNRYSQDRDLAGRADYAGRLGSYHYLDVYDIGCGDWAMYRYSIRAHKNELPVGFPNKPQPPIRKSFGPETQPARDSFIRPPLPLQRD